MKRIIIVLVVICIIILFNTIETTYTRQGVIVNNKNGIVTVEDQCGFLWEYRGNAHIGDSVTLIMNDNHTSNICDDIIKAVK